MHPVCKQLVQVKTLAPQSDLFDPGRVVGSHLQQNTGVNGFVIEIMYYIGYTVFVLIQDILLTLVVEVLQVTANVDADVFHFHVFQTG